MLRHIKTDGPCPFCGYFGTHVHTSEEIERIRSQTADELEGLL